MGRHADVQRRIRERLAELLANMPGVGFSVTEEPCVGGRRPDLAVDVLYEGRRYLLLVEVKTLASTRALIQAAHELEAVAMAADEADGVLGVLGVPHIGPALSGECRRLGLGYVDLSGNAHLAVGPLYIDISGVRSEAPTHALASVFAPKSSRVIRALLGAPDVGHLEAALTAATGASRPLVNRVVRLLEDEALCDRRDGRIYLPDPGALLDLWVESYRQRRITWRPWHVPDTDSRTLARDVTLALTRTDLRVAFTGAFPASEQAPYLIADVLHLYADSDCRQALQELGARPDEGRAQLMVNSPPWDEGVFLFASEHDGVTLVDPSQIYLDLMRMRGRGEEAAAVYREHVLGY